MQIIINKMMIKFTRFKDKVKDFLCLKLMIWTFKIK